MIILDTNVISEAAQVRPDPNVRRWLAAHPPESFFITAVTQAEILYGLELLPSGMRRTKLQAAVEATFAEEFAGRILPFDEEAARAYGRIAAQRRARGRPISPFDGQIAAIASSRNAAVATRDVRDFEGCGVTVLNPWAGVVHG
jgi:predicted nucleic acid-binding protein